MQSPDTAGMDGLLASHRWLARYNRWFNTRLFEACARLDAEARTAPRGAFFGSVQGTLNHVLWGDRVWLGRIAAQPGAAWTADPALLDLPPGARHGTVLHADWDDLWRARSALDGAFEDWLAGLAPAFLGATMHYANSQGVVRAHPVWQALTHLFNHQTHHRGQVTTLLSQAGVDVGVTDLIALL